jgi:hypothetical protein
MSVEISILEATLVALKQGSSQDYLEVLLKLVRLQNEMSERLKSFKKDWEELTKGWSEHNSRQINSNFHDIDFL